MSVIIFEERLQHLLPMPMQCFECFVFENKTKDSENTHWKCSLNHEAVYDRCNNIRFSPLNVWKLQKRYLLKKMQQYTPLFFSRDFTAWMTPWQYSTDMPILREGKMFQSKWNLMFSFCLRNIESWFSRFLDKANCKFHILHFYLFILYVQYSCILLGLNRIAMLFLQYQQLTAAIIVLMRITKECTELFFSLLHTI